VSFQQPELFRPVAHAEAAAIGQPAIRIRATESRGPVIFIRIS
jgi:hypothetical protein